LIAPERIHPTQLYELAAALFAAAMSAVMLARRTPPGGAALLGLALFTALRLAILPLRELGPAGEWYGVAHSIIYLLLLAGIALTFACDSCLVRFLPPHRMRRPVSLKSGCRCRC
jgi:hypothetical protein